jgi:type II secretory pathway pseudopilin PulG
MILGRLAEIVKKRLCGIVNDSQGSTLTETLVALAILGIVGIIFLTGLGVSSKSLIVSQQRVTAESLTKSQVEYVKNSTYDETNNPPVYTIDPDLSVPEGYSISVSAERLDPEGDGTGNDDGLQKIEVTVDFDGSTVFTLVSYLMNQ